MQGNLNPYMVAMPPFGRKNGSFIAKDANAWATETVGDARYPLSLLLRVITVSLETIKIVQALPALDILDEAASPEQGKVLPFRHVTPQPDERYRTCVPLIALKAAAGGWSDEHARLSEQNEPNTEWVAWDNIRRFAEGMFVAQVVGRSMEPTIPDGAYCLFRPVPLPSSPDRPVLVRHGGPADDETGGQYTVKLYREEKGAKGEKRIRLEPANDEFKPLTITAREANEVRVIAEVVEVLRG